MCWGEAGRWDPPQSSLPGVLGLRAVHSTACASSFPLHQVKSHLWKCLKKQMGSFLEGRSGDALPEGCPVRSRLRMGLVVLFLVEEAKLYLSEGDMTSLCSILCPSAGSPDALHSDLSHILGTSERYPGEFRPRFQQFIMIFI